MTSLPELSSSFYIEHLYRSHQPWLVKWLYLKLGCPERAEDYAQDTFCRVMAREGESTVEQPKAYLAKIATRLLIDHARRSRLERIWRETCAERAAHQAFAPSAEEVNDMLETLERIVHLLDGLGNKPRHAFLRFRLDGASQAEIADELSVSVSMVKKYVAQGLLHCHLALCDSTL